MIELSDCKPFEICSIRPPTENNSITFRLTRNCHWNKCAFCPVYKLGAKFSKRAIEDVIADIDSAKKIDDMLFERGICTGAGYGNEYERASALIAEFERELPYESSVETNLSNDCEIVDDRMRWFLSWFKDKPTIRDSIYHIIQWRLGGSSTCFLGDGDSLILKPDFLHPVIQKIKITFPSITRFTVYGRTRTAARQRSAADLRGFARAGINRVHFGLESGCDRVLEMVRKGVTAAEHIEGCLKVRESGISPSVYIMSGLGGASLSEIHAHETARVITEIQPDFVRIRSLEIFPGTPLDEMRASGEFEEASEESVVREIRTIVEKTNCRTVIMSDSASNLIQVNGNLPDERQSMLNVIDSYLELPRRKKLEFSLRARLGSFMGQYGELTDDIISALVPMIKGGTLDFSSTGDVEIETATRLIRGKLMP